jgi:glucose/arabinose dehydrogenase
LKKSSCAQPLLALELILVAGLSSCSANVDNDVSLGDTSNYGDVQSAATSATTGSVASNAASNSVAATAYVVDTVAAAQELPPKTVPMTDQRVASLVAPPGFSVEVFAAQLGGVRMLAVHNEHVYVTRTITGDVMLLSDSATDEVADKPIVATECLDGVHGIAFQDNTVYLATANDVWSAPVNDDGRFGERKLVHTQLPGGGLHAFRTLGFGPDRALYLTVGFDCDGCDGNSEEDATILRAPRDGERAVFASGLRNTMGFGWHPLTGALWGMDNGPDLRGNLVLPEELNQIKEGRNYGWPYCFAGRELDPMMGEPAGESKAEYCAGTEPAELAEDGHAVPVSMAFYTGKMFPKQYQNDAFVVMRGSTNGAPPSGYQVKRLHFDEQGKPVGFEPFVSGFLQNDGTEAFARIAGVAVHPDGSLLISDDDNGVVYRVVSE